MENEKKRNLVIIIIAVITFLLLIFAITRIKPQKQAQEPQSFAAIFATPTLSSVTPIATPNAVPIGKTWTFISMEKHVIYQNGFWYDVGTFQNIDRPDITIRAMCMAPKWPAPTAGMIYQMNDYNILFPVIDNATNNLQRFSVLR